MGIFAWNVARGSSVMRTKSVSVTLTTQLLTLILGEFLPPMLLNILNYKDASEYGLFPSFIIE